MNTQLNGKKIFISGVAGFIPGHLAEFYLKNGAQVTGVDNFLTGTRRNLEILQKYPNFTFYEQDVSIPVEKWANGNQHYDWIFSMASAASPKDFQDIPIEILRANALGTWNLLELAKRVKAQFLLASTSEVYGDPLVHPQGEDYHGNVNTLGIRAPYDEGKRFSETLAMTYHRKEGVDTRIVRIFNTYGPRMRADDGRVIPNFITQALQNRPITIYGTGKQTRSFCFVEDLISYIHAVMTVNLKLLVSPENIHMPFNIGTTQEYSVLEIAEKIIHLCQSKSKLEFLPIGSDDPKLRRPNLERLESILGSQTLKNAIKIEDGLKHTIEYFKV